MCVFACVWAVVFFGMVPIVQKKTKCLNSQQRGGETDRRGEKQTKKQTKRARQRESDFCPGNLAVYRPRTVYRDDLNHVDCLLPVWCHLLTSAWIGWLRELPCVCLSTLAVQTFLSCTAGTDRQTDGSPADPRTNHIAPTAWRTAPRANPSQYTPDFLLDDDGDDSNPSCPCLSYIPCIILSLPLL